METISTIFSAALEDKENLTVDARYTSDSTLKAGLYGQLSAIKQVIAFLGFIRSYDSPKFRARALSALIDLRDEVAFINGDWPDEVKAGMSGKRAIYEYYIQRLSDAE